MLSTVSLSWLVSPSGQEALALAASLEPREETFLTTAQRVARRYPDVLARVAVEQVLLRRRAQRKFPLASEMYFLREALEQATGHLAAAYHARRLSGDSWRFDLGCGIGGDALALASLGHVVAIDRDHLRLRVLEANAAALGLAPAVQAVQGDLLHAGWRMPSEAVAFADPGRRREGRRTRAATAYEPPLEAMVRLARGLRSMGIKVSPAIDHREIEYLDAEMDFLSEDGELKECVLWFGESRTAHSRATLLPEGHTLTGPEPDHQAVGPMLEFLLEPDPAVMRAGLVRRLAEEVGAHQVDPRLALLTANHPLRTPFGRGYRVLEALPFSEKALRAELRRLGVGQVTLKKRGSAVDTEALARRLRLGGSRMATVLLTRVLGQPLALIVERIS